MFILLFSSCISQFSTYQHLPAVTTTSASPACTKCGKVQKSGKGSCCSRGGSWFGNCGAVGNTKFRYTWYEGIQACKAQTSEIVLVQKLHASRSHPNASSDDAIVNMESGSISKDTHIPGSKSANVSFHTPTITVQSKASIDSHSDPSILESNHSASSEVAIMDFSSPAVSASASALKCDMLFHIVAYVNIMFMIVAWC